MLRECYTGHTPLTKSRHSKKPRGIRCLNLANKLVLKIVRTPTCIFIYVLFIYTRLQILAAKLEQRKNMNKETKKNNKKPRTEIRYESTSENRIYTLK